MSVDTTRTGQRVTQGAEGLTEYGTIDLLREPYPAFLLEETPNRTGLWVTIRKQRSGLCDLADIDGPIGGIGQSASFGMQAARGRQGMLECTSTFRTPALGAVA